MLNEFKASYNGVYNIFQTYWKHYGGWKSLLTSPYFHLAIVLTICLQNYWLNEHWWDIAISILPNIIGFALGGYAIWLGFGDEKFRKLIAECDPGSVSSPYITVSATFAHFIVIQITALLMALIGKATCYELKDGYLLEGLILIGLPKDTFVQLAPWGYGFGFLIMVYALTTALASTIAVFRVAYWYDTFQNKK